MKVLVTGGLGFIGSHVVDKLREKDIEVRVYDLIHNPELQREDVEYVAGSILDLAGLTGAMADTYAVYHLAAIADVDEVFEDPLYAEQVNVRGTINVLEAARRTGIRRIVYGNTTWIYSDADEVSVDEDTPVHAPSHLYTATKMAGEYYCRSYYKLYNLPTTVLRYGIPYGPRARDTLVIPNFVEKALRGDALTIEGDGLQFRQFVYVDDLAEGNVKALKSTAGYRIFNLDGKEKITIRQIAETVQKLIGNVQIEYKPGRAGDFSGKEVSSARAKRELGWEATTPLDVGICKYIEWLKSRSETRKIQEQKAEAIISSL